MRKSIGPFAAPKTIIIVTDLPKTRSGKIMRRILRKILAGEEDSLGDITTVSFYLQSLVNEQMLTFYQLSDPTVVDQIIQTVKSGRVQK